MPWGLDEQEGELQGPKDSFNQPKVTKAAAENTALREEEAAATDRNLWKNVHLPQKLHEGPNGLPKMIGNTWRHLRNIYLRSWRVWRLVWSLLIFFFFLVWSSSGSSETTGVGSYSLLQEFFPTQGSNLNLTHYRQIFYSLSQQGSPKVNTVLGLVVSDSLGPHRL